MTKLTSISAFLKVNPIFIDYLRYNRRVRIILKGVWLLSIKLYPDHKAILHFYDSLKVYEVDFLDYLTKFLSQKAYANRHFDIYVKPTLYHSAFDFIIVEPFHKIYVIQTPQSVNEYLEQKEVANYFYAHRLSTLSPTLSHNIQKSVQADELIKNALIKQLFYIYDENLLKELFEIKYEEDVLLSANDFEDKTKILNDFFIHEEDASNRLTQSESVEIKNALNPNTNIARYIPKTVPREYLGYTVSRSQAKQKFKGASGSGKTILLAKRVINSSNRLKNNGKVLVISGDISKAPLLKDIITAEAGKSLQELGVDVYSYQELLQPTEKYQALFIDDAHFLKPAWFEDLLENYFVEMTEENDFEYVVMADANHLPKVPKIFGPFITLTFDLRRITKLLNTSRKLFLEILRG